MKERIATIEAARTLYSEFKSGDSAGASRRARLKGLIDGNPPYNQARLDELGLGYVTNVNFLEARGILEQKAGASFELLFEVPTLIEVRQLRGLDPSTPAPDFGRILAEEFSRMLYNWKGFLPNVYKARHEADAYDIGLMVWRDEFDWRPKAFSRGSFLFESDAEADIDTLNAFCLRDRMTAHELYDLALADPVVSKEMGWNPELVKQCLATVYGPGQGETGGPSAYPVSDSEGAQQQIRNAEWSSGAAGLHRVKLVHLCVKETDTGEVSYYIFAEDTLPANADGTPAADGFLFRKVRRYDNMGNALWLLPYNFGDGYLKSVRGLATSIEHHCDLSNRFLGRVFDAGFTTASLLLQPETPMDLSSLQLVRAGVITVIPPKLNVIQSSFQPQIQPLMSLREMSSNLMRNHTGVWKQYAENFGENQPAKTAREVAENVAKEARMEKIGVAFEYSQMQLLYREIFRRATNRDYLTSEANLPGLTEAREFMQRCLDRGVPRKLFFDQAAWEIFATKAIGMGSWGVRLDITDQVLNARNLLDEQGQRNALRDWLAARVGQQNVDRYAPLLNRDLLPSNEASIAELENGSAELGQEVVAGSDQTHALHMYRHIVPVSEIIQLVTETRGEGMDVGRSINTLTILLPHMEEHIGYMASDPARKGLVDQLMQVVKDGAAALQYLQKLQERLDKARMELAQADAEANGQVAGAQQSTEMQVEMAKIQKDLQVEMAKQESLNGMRAEKTQGQMMIRQQQAAEQAQLRARELEARLNMEARKLEATLALQRELALSKARPADGQE